MNKDLINKYISGNCSLEEELEIIQWLRSNGYKSELKDYIDEDLAETLYANNESENNLGAIPKNIFRNDAKSNEKIPNPFKIGIGVAATLLILLTFSIYYFDPAGLVVVDSQQNSQTIAKSNQRGQKSKIFLSDGSVIHLNSESTIVYPTQFSDSLRVVELQGEAFFEVNSDPKRPFIVKTTYLNVRVLGTSFNVQTEDINQDVRISLEKGVIEVSENQDEREEIRLSKDQLITYNKDKGFSSLISGINHMAEFGWKDGTIYFKNAGLDEVLGILEKWYNVEFRLMNKASFSWSYNGVFKDQSLYNILQLMGFSQDFDFEIKDKKVDITFKQTAK